MELQVVYLPAQLQVSKQVKCSLQLFSGMMFITQVPITEVDLCLRTWNFVGSKVNKKASNMVKDQGDVQKMEGWLLQALSSESIVQSVFFVLF